MKTQQKDFSNYQELQQLINKWRNIVGIDQVYVIQLIESPDDNGYPAWVEGLSIDNPHPSVNIFINANWIQKHKNNEKEVTEVVIHELIHILLFDAFTVIDPLYIHEGVKARANELLTMKITNSIMKVYSLHNKKGE